MARIKTDSTELVTDKSLQQIANGIREAASVLNAQVDELNDDTLGKFGDKCDIEVVLSGNVGLFSGLKHFRPGGANNIWGVQVFVSDLGDKRHIELIALGEGVFAGGLFSNGAGILNLGVSKDKRDKIISYLI